MTPNTASPFIAGMALSLHCSIKVNLPGGFDLSAQWMRNSSLLQDSNDGRVVVGDLSLISQSSKFVRYLTYLEIDVLSKTLDLGSYSCVRAVYLSTSSPYVLHSMSTSTYFLNIQGEDIYRYARKIVAFRGDHGDCDHSSFLFWLKIVKWFSSNPWFVFVNLVF